MTPERPGLLSPGVPPSKLRAAKKEFFWFDAVLVAQMNDTLKQAAIEQGQWTEKRETTGTRINVMMDNINSGQNRAADAKLALDRAAEGSKK